LATTIYLMPITGLGTKADPRRPKYVSSFGADWTMMDYGPEDVCLVAVENISVANDAAVAANADVTKVPPLGQQVGGQLAAVQNALSTLNIPSFWVQSTMTYATVLRVVLLVFQFSQRFNGILPGVKLFGTGVTLSTTISALSSNVVTALNQTAASFGLSTAGITGTTTIGSALKILADQFSGIPLQLGNQAF
jgi:hypothetical protein